MDLLVTFLCQARFRVCYMQKHSQEKEGITQVQHCDVGVSVCIQDVVV